MSMSTWYPFIPSTSIHILLNCGNACCHRPPFVQAEMCTLKLVTQKAKTDHHSNTLTCPASAKSDMLIAHSEHEESTIEHVDMSNQCPEA
eukprot:6263694-Karenia_brevis.AAC.1